LVSYLLHPLLPSNTKRYQQLHMHMIKENPLGLCLLVSAQPLEIMKSRKKLDFFIQRIQKKRGKSWIFTFLWNL
jgi:hypothetical protein